MNLKIPPIIVDNIPSELKRRRQWICWRYEEREGEIIKVPIAPWNTGDSRPVNVTDPNNCVDFNTAVDFAVKNGWGLGFVFFKGAGITGIDIDKLDSSTQEYIQKADSYCEYSPSGVGVHIYGFGELKKAIKKDGIEVYSDARFFTVTGEKLPSSPTALNNIQHVLDLIQARYSEASDSSIPAKIDWSSYKNKLGYTLSEIRRKNSKLDKLLDGVDEGYPSPSEADMACLSILLHWGYTREEAVEILKGFRYRDKLLRDDYIQRTLEKIGEVETVKPKVSKEKEEEKQKLHMKLFEHRGSMLLYTLPASNIYSSGSNFNLSILGSFFKKDSSIFLFNTDIPFNSIDSEMKQFLEVLPQKYLVKIVDCVLTVQNKLTLTKVDFNQLFSQKEQDLIAFLENCEVKNPQGIEEASARLEIENKAQIEKVKNYPVGIREEVLSLVLKLYDRLRYYYYHEDERVYKALVTWILGTWLHQLFPIYPHLILYGPRETGKGTVLKIINNCCHTLSEWIIPSEAVLYRAIELLQPVVLMDEAQASFKDNPAIAMIFEVNEKDKAVPRMEKEGEKQVVRNYYVYSPKALATREEISAMEKGITIITTEAPKNIPYAKRWSEIDDDPAWKEIIIGCLEFALLYWPEVLKAYNELTPTENLYGRDFQIWRPLLAIAKIIGIYDSLLKYAEEVTLEKRAERSARDIEDVLLKLLIENSQEDEDILKIYLYQAVELLQSEIGENIIRSPQRVRGVLKRLGCIVKEDKDKLGRFYYINIKAVEAKASRRGIKAERGKSTLEATDGKKETPWGPLEPDRGEE